MKQLIKLLSFAALLIPVVLGLYISCRYLPSVNETQPRGPSQGDERNWLGQSGGVVYYGYPFALVLASYGLKRIILTNCTWPATAAYFFAVFVGLSLPYIWFLCEPNWFDNSGPTISCWLWFPIGIWFVPTASFLFDLVNWETAKRLDRFVVRSMGEVILAWPIWMVVWAWFACLALRWWPLII